MAKENVEIEVTGFQSLRAQLKEANMEVQKMVALFGETSPQVAAAAQKAAELKDQVDDARDAVNAFTGAGKFEAFGKVIQGVAGGFTAVQGAMGLLGVESEDLQKTMLKVQSAMALTQGLAALEDLGRAFGTVKTVAVNAFNSIKAAIGSTGIGLLIVALGTAVAYWEEISGAIFGNQKSTEELEKSQEQYNRQLEYTNFLVSEYRRDFENSTKIAIAQAQARGASAKELADIEIAGREKIIKLLKQESTDAYNNFRRTVAGLKETEDAYIKAGDAYRAVARKNDAEIDNLNAQNKIDAINAQKQITEDYRRRTEERTRILKQANEEAKRQTEESYDRQTKNYQQIALLDTKLNDEQRERLKLEFDQLNERAALIEKTVAIEAKASSEKRELTKEEVKERKALNAELDVVILRQAAETARLEFDIQKKKQEDLKRQAEEYARILQEREQKKFNRSVKITDDYFAYQRIALDESNLNVFEYNKKQEELELKRLERQLAIAEKAGEDTTALEEQIAAQKKKIRDKDVTDAQSRNQALLSAAGELVGALQSLSQSQMSKELAAAKDNAQKQEEIKKEYFQKDKNFQYAKTTIAGIQAGMQAFAQGMEIGGPVLAGILLAASAATTLVQLAAIMNTQYVGGSTSGSASSGTSSGRGAGSQYEEGGLLMGPSHDMGGIRTTLGELEGGEFVMNKRSTANFLPLLQRMNQMGNIPGPEVKMTSGTPVIKTYVLASDVTSAQEANARLKTLARL